MTTDEVRYYDAYTDDFVTSAAQDTMLPANYSWADKPAIPARVVTRLARGIGWVYCRLALHQRVVGADKLRNWHGGAFVYATHTQPVGDVVTPLIVGGGRKMRIVASPANRGVPILGRILEYGGGVMLPTTLHQLGAFQRAIKADIVADDIVTVYPEAHVWPYATMIRPFVPGSLHYPVATSSAVFTATRTYQQRCGRRRPRQTVFIDGPFWPDGTLGRKQQQRVLALQLRATMQWRAAQNNTQCYVDYRRRDTVVQN